MDVGSVDVVDTAPMLPSETGSDVGSLPEMQRDKEGDLRLREALKAFGEKTIVYSFDYRPWEIKVLSAADGESLRQDGVPSGMSYALLFKEAPPAALQMHVEKLARQQKGDSLMGFIGVMPMKIVPVVPPPPVEVGLSIDVPGDDRIAACFQSEGFVSEAITYIYKGDTYQVRIINNPDKLPLWAEGATKVFNFPYAIIISGLNPPKDLVAHLKKLAEVRWKKTVGYVPTEGFLFDDHFHRTAGLGPIMINRDGNLDGTFNQLIRDSFASHEFVSRVFHYEIGGKEYHVRIINNPGKQNVRIIKPFADPYGVREYKLDWAYRYGIMSDEKIPPELVKHIEDLAKPKISWWDWYRSFDVINGPRDISLKGGKKVTIGYRALFEYAHPE
ncbi:MAG: hypothetical protein JSR58_07260 [Verrucomicrobia bacterium]|nr:hypothetical protein [Verrucomicrobiota bacterium]